MTGPVPDLAALRRGHTQPELMPRWRLHHRGRWHAVRRGIEGDRMLCGVVIAAPTSGSRTYPHDGPVCHRCAKAWDTLGRPW